MLHKEINIELDYTGLNLEHDTAFQPVLTTYVLDPCMEGDFSKPRPAVIVCPGGSYEFTSDREAEPVALAWNTRGYHAFVLRYSVAPARFPCALFELATAVSLVRKHAEKWHIDPNCIYVCGFSAGGHLTASLGVFWDSDFLKGALSFQKNEHRPNGLILSYPVITSGEFTHEDSMKNLLGERYNDPYWRKKLSLELQVSAMTPRCFLWHTYDDDLVPVENSLLFASALRRSHIPLELHIYPKGVHGLSLANEQSGDTGELVVPEIQNWIDMAARWGKR